MGYSPLMWGREAWHFIHYVCLNYPYIPTQEDKENYEQFFKTLPLVLPCPHCGNHFLEHMKKLPIRLDTKRELFAWSVDMHNEVNIMNGKKVLSYEEARDEINKNSMRGVQETYAMNHRKVQNLYHKMKDIKRNRNKF